MKKQPDMVDCKVLWVKVDLWRGFEKCIEDHQCFSDDPCPWSRQFHRPPAPVEGAIRMTATPGPSRATSP